MKPELKADVNLASTRGQAVPTPETDAIAISATVSYGSSERLLAHARKLERERDRLLAVNKTLVEALEKIAADTERQQLPITTMIHLDAKAALKAGKV